MSEWSLFKRRALKTLVLGAVLLGFQTADAQVLVREKMSVGFRGGGIFGNTELDDKLGPQFNIFLRRRFNAKWQGEVGTGYSRFNGTDYGTDIGSVNLRAMYTPIYYRGWNPFLYTGFTALRYDLDKIPPGRGTDIPAVAWKGNLPIGAGIQVLLLNNVALEVSGGYNLVRSDNINGNNFQSGDDKFWGLSAGLTVGNLGTERDRPFQLPAAYVPPTPLDSDSDGLSDDQELALFRTNPRVADSDGDGLSDIDEIKNHKTNPNLADSDGGGDSDGRELELGNNPLNASDDGPQDQQTLVLQPSIFMTFYFAFDKKKLGPEGRRLLNDTAGKLQDYPGVQLEIRGYADDQGVAKYNVDLSRHRAETIKAYLVAQGIEAWRLSVKALGEAPTESLEEAAVGQQHNRRVEVETVFYD